MSVRKKWGFLTSSHPRRVSAVLAAKVIIHAVDWLPCRIPADVTETLRFQKHPCSSDDLRPWREEILADANEVLRGNVDCFGLARFTREIPWNVDFFSGTMWPPGKRASTYRPFVVPSPEDGKVPYELSRCQHFLPLAKAALCTGEQKYVKRIEYDITSWWESNPFNRSVNWTCAMDVAIRAVNWILAIEISGGATAFRSQFIRKLARSLYEHGLFIWRHLEDYAPSYNTNHYLSNLVGLLYISSCFPSDRHAQRWGDFARPELMRETRLQFFASGVNYELSTSYHRLSTELILSALWRMRSASVAIPDDIVHRMKCALRYTAHLTRTDGSVPQIGDNDDGRLHILGRYLGWNRHDHRYLLALGSVILKDIDLLRLVPGELQEAVVLTGITPVGIREPGSPPTSLGYEDAGIYILRNSRFHVVVKISNIGLYGTSGPHNHNDVLSFDLAVDGRPMLVDPGTGQYTGDIRERNHFRSTAAHNTVMIDGVEQNEIGPLDDIGAVWAIGGQALSHVEHWGAREDSDQLVGKHHGYTRLGRPVIHRRSFLVEHEAMRFSIRDSFECQSPNQEHLLEWSFMLHPDVQCRQLEQCVLELSVHGVLARLVSEVPLSLNSSLYSPSYKRTAPTTRISCRANDPKRDYSFAIILPSVPRTGEGSD